MLSDDWLPRYRLLENFTAKWNGNGNGNAYDRGDYNSSFALRAVELKSGDIIFIIISLWGFFRLSRAANSAVGGSIKAKFELVRALIHVIIACKYKKELMKNSRENVETPFFHHNPICYHGNQWLDLAIFQTHPSSYVCKLYLQV